MSVSPYTLNMLYQQGILDYVPIDLAAPSPIGFMGTAQNPYLNSAMSGDAFQNYGQNDSFNSSINSNIAYNNSSIGIKNNSASNTFGLQGIGDKFQGNFFGFNGIGGSSNSANNAYGLSGIGTKAENAEMNAWGISVDTQNLVGQAASSLSNNSIIKPLLGLGLLLIAGLSVKKMFKGMFKKSADKTAKEVAEKKSFKTKINPKNWKIFNKKKA